LKLIRSRASRLSRVLASLLLTAGAGAWLQTPAAAQTVQASTYPFTASTGVSVEDMSAGTSQIIGPGDDNGVSAVTDIGFEFWFAGARYTSFSLISDGLIRLGSTAVQSAPTNDLTSIVNAPQIAPYWDNLWVGTNGKIHYKVVGAAPNRRLVLEWRNLQVPRLGGGFNGSAIFQCWLHEGTGKIQFVYGPGLATNAAQSGASIGLGAINGSFASVTVATSTVDYSAVSNANVLSIPSGTSYAFAPPVPATPTGLSFSAVGATGMTLQWNDVASNEAGYAIWRSTDGVNYTFVTQTSANAASSVQIGLVPATSYSWIVRAVSDGALSGSLPGSQATTAAGNIVTAGSGNWSSTVPNAPWPDGIVPTSTDVVTIADGTTVTVDATASCYALNVGQGTSGALGFEGTTARTLTVVTDVSVQTGAVLASAATGTQTGHVLSLAGSLANQGTVDFSTSGDLAGATIVFTGASNSSLTGNGPVTDVRAITASKTSGATLTLDAPGFTVQGTTTGAAGFLTLTSGTFRLSGSFTMSSAVFPIAGYTLATGTTFWLDNPNFTVTGQAGSATVRGFRVSAGTFQVGNAAGHSLQLASGASVTIEGGQITTAGRFGVSTGSNTITYVQSGGTVVANTAGNPSTSLASFDLGTGSSSSVTITGGTIVLQNASSAVSGPRDYRNSAGAQNITGGTLRLGNSSSGAPQIFVLNGSAPALVISNDVGGHTARLVGATTVVGATQITASATLDLNGLRFTQATGSLVNDGNLLAATGSSELYFSGTASPQTYSGSGVVAGPIVAFSVNNPAGVTLDAGLASNLVARRVSLVRGTLGNSNKLTIGNADSVVAETQIGEIGVAGTGGSYDVAPVFNPGSGGYAVSYVQEGLRSTGLEIPAGRSLSSLALENPNSIAVVTGGALTLTEDLTLTAGLLSTTATDVVVLADTTAGIPAGSAQSYVDGPLAIAVTSNSATRTFAVGRQGAFRPLTLSSVNTGGVSRTYTVELIAGASGGTPTVPLTALTQARYWRIGNSAQLNASARAQLAFGTDDNVGTLSSLRVGQAATAAGAYANLGGSATGTASSGAVISTSNLVPGSDYFVVATSGTLASTWDGGAGTTNWGDADNWNPNGVPVAGTNVTLSPPTPVTIQVSGAFPVNNLTVNSNTTVQLASGTLTVGGTFNQISGLVQSTGGALFVTGATALDGGTLDLGAGSFTSNGALTITGATVNLSSGTLLENLSLAINGGVVSLNSGTLEVKGNLSISAGNFFPGSGTTIISGTTAQVIGGGFTFHNLILRNGGSGQPKRFTSFFAHVISNDLTVESTAQMGLTSSDATPMTVWGNFHYSGLTGGTSISSLTINLAGVGRTFGGVGAPGLALDEAAASLPTADANIPVEEVFLLTDPTRARRTGREVDGKPEIELENTYEKRRGEVERLLHSRDPRKRLVINLDDMTLVQGVESQGPGVLAATTSLPMPVTVVGTGSYALDGNVSMGSGRTLTVSGRLTCGTLTVGGAGGVSVRSLGTLATATSSASGLLGTVTTTGTNSYLDGAVIEYNRAGDQTIHAANHPAAALIRTGGSGIKTLTANKTLTGSSGGLLDRGALFVGTGTTFADGGNRLSLTSSLFANVIVNGTYTSSGSGSLSFEAGTFNSNVLAADGTTFGDLLLNFASSTQTIDLNATGTANLTFRNLTFGGTAGAGTAGGTLRLSESGTTNVMVTGATAIAPSVTTNSGGGFGGTAGKSSLVTLQGSLSSTSVNAVQPIVNDVGPNVLRLAGSSSQTLTLASSATILTGATLDVLNTGGLTLGGAGIVYAVGANGSVGLNGRNVAAGSNTLALSPGAAFSAGGGRVIGRLRKNVAPGATSVPFEIGTATDPTPVTLSFTTVTAPGDITVRSELGDHPQVATSGVDAAKSLNLHYFADNTGATFGSCNADLVFPAGAVDGGANPAAFIVSKHDGSAWQKVTAANPTATSIRAAGLTSLGSFATGEQLYVAVTSSAGAHGAIAPLGVTPVAYGDSLPLSFTPDVGYHVADVLLDGGSVGAPASYTLQNVIAPHTVAVSFAINVYEITAVAGYGGAIAPAGAVMVTHGNSQAFTFTPDEGFHIDDVVVDGGSVGTPAGYTFENVAAAHTLTVTFAAIDAVIFAAAPATAISSAYPCVTVPIRLERTSTTPLRAFSVLFTLPADLTLCSGMSSITEGSFLSSSGTTSYNVVDRGGGAWQVDCAILGAGCGPTDPEGTLFSIAVTSAEDYVTTTIDLDSLRLRDCSNQNLLLVEGPAPVITVDHIAPVVSVTFPNGGEILTIDSTAVVTWNSSDNDSVGTVDLSYSTDGGQTFPTVIATAVPDIGSFPWTVPGVRTTEARVKVVAHDTNGNTANDASNADFEIRETNLAPVLAAIGSKGVNEGAPLTFTAVASDTNIPPQSLTFSLDTGAPAGASIDPGTGVFTWTPTEAQGPGSHAVTVRVTDDGLPPLEDFETLTIQVNEVAQAPVLAAIGNRTVSEGTALSFTAGATDGDLPAQTLTFSLDAGSPPGAGINPTTGVFTWTPTEAQGPGDYSITVRVTDNGTPVLDDFETFSTHVEEVNQPPVLSNIPVLATIGELVFYSFDGAATDADLPAQSLTFSTIAAPVGASIDPGTGVFTWTPTEAQGPGSHPFTVRVSDGVTNTDAPITLTVNEANVAPVLAAIGNQSVNEGVLLTFTASATDADLPAQTLTYSLDGGAPAGASIGGSSGVFTWTPSETQGPGDYSITVRVTDNGTPALDDFETISVHVDEANVAPVLSNVSNATIPELALHTFTASATDADVPAQTLTFSLVGAPAGASIDPGTGAFSWTPTEAQGPGAYPFTVRVSDGVVNTDLGLTLTVTESNAAPVLSGVPASATIPELALYSFSASATDADVPVQTLTFSLVGAPPGASIVSGTGAFSWTPTEAQGPGVYPFTVRISDGVTNTDAAITLTVAEVNAAPVLSGVPASATIPELALYSFSASATDADVPVQTLTFSLVGAPPGASIVSGTGAFSWTPTEAQGPGVYPFTVRVSDGVANTDAAITLTVTEANAAPVLSGVPASATIPELALYSFSASATDADVPVQTLTFSLVGAPPGAGIVSGTGAFSWTPTEAQGPGAYPFTVRVTDGVTNTDAAITLTVSEANVAPVLSGVPASANIPELALYTFTASATDADLPAQTLTFSLVGAPPGASIVSGTGAFSWTPTEAQGPGVYPFTVRVSDGVMNTDAGITLTVTEANAAPVLSGVPASATIPELALYSFSASATDADVPVQTLTFSLVGAPPGASIVSGTGAFSWTPTEAQGPGVYPFTVRVTDGVTNTDAAITLTVSEANAAPVLSGVPASASIPELALYSFSASATDADLPVQTLTFSLVGAPPGAGIVSGTGAFSWTPTEAQGPGAYPFTVRVTDGVTNTDAAITLTVTEANAAPVLSGVPASATIPELALYTFTASATDADLPAQTLTFSLVGAPPGASIVSGTGAFSWTPTEAQGPGAYPFTVRVSDGVTNTDAAITLTVTEANAAPVLTGVPASATIPELALYSFSASATDADVPVQTLTFSLVGAPPGASIVSGTGAFSWTPTEAQGPGVYPFTVRVTDGVANTDAAITLTVTDVNVAPVLSGIPASATIPELVLYSFAASATDADLPAQTLTFSLVGAPTGASIVSGTGAFSWTPTEAQGPGIYPFTVRVTDGVTNTDAAITLTVTNVNVAPVLSGVPASATIPELVLYTFTASATDADLPVQTLTFSLVGAPAGASIVPATGAFSWTPTEPQGPGVYPFTVRVTDGVANTDAAITLTVSDVEIPALASLAATQTTSGNDADGTTRISFAWTPPGAGTVEVYRAPYGSYPEYDDGSGAVPSTPSYPPGAPWTLTAVTTPGATDEPATRDFHYYVAFVHGAGANVSGPSNVVAAFNYHLGDVSNGVAAGQGNNVVDVGDISLLGAHYGLSGAAVAPYAYLDVGPTTDFSVNSRPTTDNQIEFEDLVMFAINFGAVAKPARPLAVATSEEVLTLVAPGQVAANQDYNAAFSLAGSGGLKAISVRLSWNPAVVQPVVATGSAGLASQGGIAFSAAPGSLDAALLGPHAAGLSGVIGTISFHAIAAGDPEIEIQTVRARNPLNQNVAVTTTTTVDAPTTSLPKITSFRGCYPNPMRGTGTFEFALAQSGPVELEIYSVDGRRVRTLATGTMEPGTVLLPWDGRDDDGRILPAAVYYARLRAPHASFTRSIVLVK